MDVKEFLEEWKRMCDAKCCSECKIGSISAVVCMKEVFENPQKTIEVVEKWSKQHPKTKRVFSLDKYVRDMARISPEALVRALESGWPQEKNGEDYFGPKDWTVEVDV